MNSKTLRAQVSLELARAREELGIGGIAESEAARVLAEALAVVDPALAVAAMADVELQRELQDIDMARAVFAEIFYDEGFLRNWRDAAIAEMAKRGIGPAIEVIATDKTEQRALRLWAKSLFPYQARWLRESAPFAVALKGRQLGFSFAASADSVKRALVEHSTNIILSASQSLSNEVLAKCKRHATVLARLGYKGAVATIDNTTCIGFRNGGRVMALPASERTARSFSGHVTIDEMAFLADAEGVWSAVAASTTRSTVERPMNVRIVSTPNGSVGKYFNLVSDVSDGKLGDGWKLHKVSIDDAEQQGMIVDRDRLWQLAECDARLYAQWFECSFIGSDIQYLDTELVDAALKWKGDIPNWRDADIFAGLDVGRQKDLSVLTVVAVVDGIGYVLAIETAKRKSFEEQRAMVAAAYSRFQWDELHVDQTGLGVGLVEALQEDYDDECVGVNFTIQEKAALASRLFRWLSAGKLRLIRNSEGKALRDELIGIRRIVNPNTGNVSYDHPQTSKGHGDRAWSLALSLRAAGIPAPVMSVSKTPLLAI